MNAHLQLYTHEFDHNKVWLSWIVFTANVPATAVQLVHSQQWL